MNETKQLLIDIVKDATEDRKPEVFNPELLAKFTTELIELGKQQCELDVISEANTVASLLTTVLVGDMLDMLGMEHEQIPQGIQMFMATRSDDIYLVLGALALAAENKVDFEGEKL